MMDAILVRRNPEAPGFPVLGNLVMPSGSVFATLEDALIAYFEPGWPYTVVKYPGGTAIPGGRYRLIVGWSTRFQKDLPRLLDVPGFSGILIHPGNSEGDTAGCILAGTKHGPDGKTIIESQAAVLAILTEIRTIPTPLYLDIRNPVE